MHPWGSVEYTLISTELKDYLMEYLKKKYLNNLTRKIFSDNLYTKIKDCHFFILIGLNLGYNFNIY